MAHQDRRCASDAETIYVQFTPACTSDSILTAGTPTVPFCNLSPAVIALSMARRVIVVRGTVGGTSIGGGFWFKVRCCLAPVASPR
jgi:hypothetical protein